MKSKCRSYSLHSVWSIAVLFLTSFLISIGGLFGWSQSAAATSTKFSVTTSGKTVGQSGQGNLAPEAETSRWRSTNGPMAGSVTSLLRDGDKLLAGSYSGLYVSTDQGKSWKRNDKWLEAAGTSPNIFSLARSGSTLYAGASGLFRSTDNGNTWTRVGGGVPEFQAVNSVFVSGSSVFAVTFAGAFASFDGGGSWSLLPIPATDVIDLAANSSAIFALTDKGVLRSTDSGRSWIDANAGLPKAALLDVPATPASIAVLEAKIFVSYVLSAVRGSGGRLPGPKGVYVSSDQGASWASAGTELADASVFRLFANGQDLFASTDKGVFRSSNEGASWTEVNKGLRGDFNQAFAADGTSIYLGGSTDVYVSMNKGDDWTALNVRLNVASPGAFAVQGDNLFAAARGNGVFRLNMKNQVAGWERVNSGLMTSEITALAVSGNDLFCGSIGGGVYRSSDQGQSWTATSNGLANPLVQSLAVVGSNVFAGTLLGGVFRSADRGQTWVAVNQGLEDKFISILVAKGNSLFAGTASKGMFRSDDNGANWKAINNGLIRADGKKITVINSIAANSSALFLYGEAEFDGLGQASGSELFRSLDNGESWTRISALPNLATPTRLAANETQLFAASFRGVFLSTDQGVNWREINDGLPTRSFVFGIPEPQTVEIGTIFLSPTMIWATGYGSFGLCVGGGIQINGQCIGGIGPGGIGFLGGFSEFGVYARELATITCKYKLNETQRNSPPEGGQYSVQLVTESSCPWTAKSNVDWITVTSPTESTGNGEVKFTVAVNPNPVVRVGTLTIGGETYSVTQFECATITPSFQAFEQAGGQGSVNVTGHPECSWSVVNTAGWVTITAGATGKGSGKVDFTIAPNASSNSRRAVLKIAGQQFVVSQAAANGACGIVGTIAAGQVVRGELTSGDCQSEREASITKRPLADRYRFEGRVGQSVVLNLNSPNFSPTVALMSPTGALVASEIGAQSGFGARLPATGALKLPATGTYVVEVSSYLPGEIGRYALSLSVLNDGCSYTISPTSRIALFGGDTFGVTVTTGQNCGWQAISQVDWVAFTSVTNNGVGSGTATYKVNANAGDGRSTVLQIAGESFFVIQNRNVNPVLAVTGLSPSSARKGAPGFTLTVNGAGFVNGSKVLWNGRERSTMFVSSTQLKAEILPTDLTVPDAYVSVFNPEPNGGTSGVRQFTLIPVNQHWTQTAGPGGGSIITIYSSGQYLFAATIHGGVYRSADRGQSWQRKLDADESDFRVVNRIAANGNFVCLGRTNDVSCSKDGGETWTFGMSATGNIYPTGYSMLAYADGIVIGTNRGLMFARAADQVLTPFDNQLKDRQVNSLAAIGRTIFAVADFNGLYLIREDGTAQQLPRTGLPEFSQFNDLLAADGKLHLATDSGVFLSTDQGQSWRRVGTFGSTGSIGLGLGSVRSLALVGSTLFASTQPSITALQPRFFFNSVVYRLNDNGDWVELKLETPANVYALAADGANLLAATQGAGIFHSTDKGQSWQRINRGLAATRVIGFASVGSALYAAADGAGVFRSNDEGRSWTPLNNGFKTLSFTKISANGSVLFAAGSDGIYRSTDEGRNWINTGLPSQFITSMAFSGDNVFVGASGAVAIPVIGIPGQFGGSLGGLFISNNNGQSWRDVSSNMPNGDVLALLVKGQNLFAGTGEGLFVSTNNGLSWKLASEEIGWQRVLSLAVVGETILASAQDGVYGSDNNGQSWRLKSRLQNNTITSLTVSGSRVFGVAGFGSLGIGSGGFPVVSGGLVVVSENKGESWAEMPGGMESKMVSTVLAHNARLFAGTFGSGAFVSDLAPGKVVSVSAASFSGAELAPDSIATAFGSNLATETQLAAGQLTEELGGTRVIVRDSLGQQRAAKLFYVSFGQVNFLIPKDTAVGDAEVTILNSNGAASTGALKIAAVAPALFTANGSGSGLASGLALRIRANGERVYEALVRFDPVTNQPVAVPIDLSNPADQAFLVLFGTGIKGNRGLSGVTAKIGGIDAPVLYAGAQGDLAGFDQVNISLPRTLTGRGTANVELTVEGKRANTVVIGFR